MTETPARPERAPSLAGVSVSLVSYCGERFSLPLVQKHRKGRLYEDAPSVLRFLVMVMPFTVSVVVAVSMTVALSAILLLEFLTDGVCVHRRAVFQTLYQRLAALTVGCVNRTMPAADRAVSQTFQGCDFHIDSLAQSPSGLSWNSAYKSGSTCSRCARSMVLCMITFRT